MFEFGFKNESYELKKYTGTDLAVTVPAQEKKKDVRGIGRYAFAENRQVEEVFLPDGIWYIDRHAFYNCRKLRKISVPGKLMSVEDGAFKNCEKLSELELRNAEPGNTCLKHLIYDQNHALRVVIHYQQNMGTACLSFPDFEYEYIANEPARIFNEVGYGAGYLYQQCFFDNDVDYARYDSIFASACVSETMETLFIIALMRLAYPYHLLTEAENLYRNYINRNLVQICLLILKQEDREKLFLMESLGFFTEEALPELIEAAGRQQLMKGVAWLLNYQKVHFSYRKNDFEL